VRALEKIQNPYNLDKTPLLQGSGKEFTFQPFETFNQPHSTFMSAKSVISDGKAGGNLLQLNDHSLFVFGIREELLQLVANQDLKQICKYSATTETVKKTVHCKVSAGRFERMSLPIHIQEEAIKKNGYYVFDLDGFINYSRCGLVFGELPLTDK
jgi:hypothetical protein